MNERTLRDFFIDVLETEALHPKSRLEVMPTRLDGSVERVRTFIDANVFTPLTGIVIETTAGEEFQITVTQTKHAPSRAP